VILEETIPRDGKSYYKVRAGDVEGWIVKDMALLLDDAMKAAIAATQAAQPKSGALTILFCDACNA